jgi:hypothetical protein
MAERFELDPQFLEVVDLAVVYDDDAAVLVEKGLLASRHVDDRQAAMAETDSRLEVKIALVRATVLLNVVHSHDQLARNRSSTAEIHHTDEAAHVRDPDE